jgi:hypothetical protein
MFFIKEEPVRLSQQVRNGWLQVSNNRTINPWSMNNPNRDLLVLFNHEVMTQKAIEHEVEQLHQLLYAVEGIENLIITHEVIDLNRYRVISKPAQLRRLIRQRELKPFIFLNCKN